MKKCIFAGIIAIVSVFFTKDSNAQLSYKGDFYADYVFTSFGVGWYDIYCFESSAICGYLGGVANSNGGRFFVASTGKAYVVYPTSSTDPGEGFVNDDGSAIRGHEAEEGDD